MKTRILWLTIFFVVILFCFESANACSCVGSKPPCGGVDKSAIVFSGEVIDVTVHPEERTEKYKDLMPFIGKKAQVKVLEAFNNITVKNIVIETGLGGGDCGYDFKEGEKYLIYAREHKGRILTSICSRTQVLTSAQGDVEILRELNSKNPVKSRIFGNSVLIDRENDYSSQSMARVKIVAKSETGENFTTETDSVGFYQIVGLPAGKYTLQATYKSNFIKVKEVEIKPKSGEQCAEGNFYYSKGGRITGKIADSDGKPIIGLRVIAMQLAFSEGKERDWTSYDGYTDENGKYEIEGLPSSNYYLGFNFFEPIKKEFPYPPMFYPEVKTKVEAARISVTDEFSLNDYDFIVSEKIKPRLINGTIKLLNGKPAIGAEVELKEERTSWGMDKAEIDEKGIFSLKSFEGQSYYLYISVIADSSLREKEVRKIYIPKIGKIEDMEIILPIHGQIEGIITDESGKLIEEGADVFLQCSNSTGLSEERISDWAGKFYFPLFEGCKYKAYAKFTYGKFEGLESKKIDISEKDIGKQIKFLINTKNK